MARFDVGITIKRPVEDVFAVLSDASIRLKWASGEVEAPKKTSDGPTGVGMTWHGVGRLSQDLQAPQGTQRARR